MCIQVPYPTGLKTKANRLKVGQKYAFHAHNKSTWTLTLGKMEVKQIREHYFSWHTLSVPELCLIVSSSSHKTEAASLFGVSLQAASKTKHSPHTESPLLQDFWKREIRSACFKPLVSVLPLLEQSLWFFSSCFQISEDLGTQKTHLSKKRYPQKLFL